MVTDPRHMRCCQNAFKDAVPAITWTWHTDIDNLPHPLAHTIVCFSSPLTTTELDNRSNLFIMSIPTKHSKVDVLVVGAGPAGLMCAYALANLASKSEWLRRGVFGCAVDTMKWKNWHHFKSCKNHCRTRRWDNGTDIRDSSTWVKCNVAWYLLPRAMDSQRDS